MRLSLETSAIAFLALLPAGLAGFAGLAAYVLFNVANALALVRLGRMKLADARCDFADDLAVGTGERNRNLLLDARLHARRKLVDDRMREPERQMHFLAARVGAVSDAGDLELARETRRDAGHRI